ncbi:hypothetical protein KIN20_006316 [Parelaphostrongylus tenuis]|uniref:Uncharacterized protein n=1 Tax=Parelaphostrongylus tenuis TaxID=148309 RepID=A0AAD5QJ98_PARTN|nr:hypothetical protein KIN20_006316 [Parelaphostrongylus tenuis]
MKFSHACILENFTKGFKNEQLECRKRPHFHQQIDAVLWQKSLRLILVPKLSVFAASWSLIDTLVAICCLTSSELERDAQIVLESINRADFERFLYRRTAFRFSVEFRADNTNLKNQVRSGSPREVDREAVIEAMEGDRSLNPG